LLVFNIRQRSANGRWLVFFREDLIMDRYAVFIDGGYARKVFEQFGNPRISYLKFSQHVAAGQERLRTYYYDCAPYVSSPPTPEERARKAGFDRFAAALEQQSRFQVRLGRLAKRGEFSDGTPKFEQKMVDILLAVDLVQLSVGHQIQRAVLLAKDSDFVPAIQIARNAGTVVELYYHIPPRPHTELMNACDDRILIDSAFIDQIKLD
jgi:uncharacterized LabA/DUF88 family protein